MVTMDISFLKASRRRLRLERHQVMLFTALVIFSYAYFRSTWTTLKSSRGTAHPLHKPQDSKEHFAKHDVVNSYQQDTIEDRYPELKDEYSHRDVDGKASRFSHGRLRVKEGENDIAAVPLSWKRHIQFTNEIHPAVRWKKDDKVALGNRTMEVETTTNSIVGGLQEISRILYEDNVHQNYSDDLDTVNDDTTGELHLENFQHYPTEEIDSGITSGRGGSRSIKRSET
ncbi:hypothetical protein Q1695_004794 [Nippostrongylus brasiliensis]|nr:hypothetical protein Q1695_004794 [Nippostrongylus brasiliensis]